MVLDKFVDIEIQGKTYKLCYPLKYVWMAERQLTDRNFMLLIGNAANDIPPNMSDIYVIFKYALMGGNPQLSEDKAEELFLAALDENNMITLFEAALKALEKSGAMGKQKKAQAAPQA